MKEKNILEVDTWKTSRKIWKHLKKFHETLEKGRAFFLNDISFSIMMD
jgi:hypothetical protein